MKSSDSTLHTIHMDGAASYNLIFPFPNQVISSHGISGAGSPKVQWRTPLDEC